MIPEIFVFMGGMLGLIFGILCLLTANERGENGAAVFGFILSLIGLALFSWFSTSALHTIKYNPSVFYTVYSVNGTDVINTDEDLINLNKITGKDWVEGSQVKVSKPETSYNGIDWSMSCKNKTKYEKVENNASP